MNDFQVVRRRQRKDRKSQNSTKHRQPLDILLYNDDFNIEKCKHQINTCQNELIESKFLEDFYTLLFRTNCDDDKLHENCEDSKSLSFKEIIVYGIGSLCNSFIARYQFAFVEILTKKIGVDCFLYDPVLTPNEKIMIKEYGIHLINGNEECKRKVDEKTIFLMLHCGISMYNNLLWANWGLSLQNIYLIGNCFSSYEDRIPSRELADSSKYLKYILPYTYEYKVNNSFCHDDIFNDTAIHIFPEKLLLKVSNEIWLVNEEPSNQHDNEIITNK